MRTNSTISDTQLTQAQAHARFLHHPHTVHPAPTSCPHATNLFITIIIIAIITRPLFYVIHSLHTARGPVDIGSVRSVRSSVVCQPLPLVRIRSPPHTTATPLVRLHDTSGNCMYAACARSRLVHATSTRRAGCVGPNNLTFHRSPHAAGMAGRWARAGLCGCGCVCLRDRMCGTRACVHRTRRRMRMRPKRRGAGNWLSSPKQFDIYIVYYYGWLCMFRVCVCVRAPHLNDDNMPYTIMCPGTLLHYSGAGRSPGCANPGAERTRRQGHWDGGGRGGL